MLGQYTNKHNGRTIEIDRLEIGDSGTAFWYAGEYDMFTDRDLEKHWIAGTVDDTQHEITLLRLSDAVRDVCEYCIQNPISSTDMNQLDLVDTLHKFLATQLGVDSDSLYLREGVEAQMLGVDEE
tara:strand:- start:109 stop:483 length:375 start_codon:yes stop_codon:yes gene_type:complete